MAQSWHSGWECPSSPTSAPPTWLPAAKARRWFPSSTTCFIAISAVGRIVQNIGGIGNLSAIPANAAAAKVSAFDTGPGNMVIDAVTERLFRKPFDRDGRIAASGNVLEQVLASLLREPFFHQAPPKTAGREEFGADFLAEFLRRCSGANSADIVATATALTVRSIADSLQRFVIQTPQGLSQSSSSRAAVRRTRH